MTHSQVRSVWTGRPVNLTVWSVSDAIGCCSCSANRIMWIASCESYAAHNGASILFCRSLEWRRMNAFAGGKLHADPGKIGNRRTCFNRLEIVLIQNIELFEGKLSNCFDWMSQLEKVERKWSPPNSIEVKVERSNFEVQIENLGMYMWSSHWGVHWNLWGSQNNLAALADSNLVQVNCVSSKHNWDAEYYSVNSFRWRTPLGMMGWWIRCNNRNTDLQSSLQSNLKPFIERSLRRSNLFLIHSVSVIQYYPVLHTDLAAL